MTPALPDMLLGQAMALSAPQPPESTGDYMAGRIGMIAMLAILAAQEAERGLAARTWENGALIALFERAAAAYDEALGASFPAPRRRIAPTMAGAPWTGPTPTCAGC